MENDLILDENHITNNLAISLNAKNYLKTSSKWGKFLAVLGFIFSTFALIGGLGVLVTSSVDLGFIGLGTNIMIFIGLGYICVAAIFSYLSYLLFSFCSNAKKSVENTDSLALETSINQLKKFFVITGIATVAIIFFNIVAMINILGGIVF